MKRTLPVLLILLTVGARPGTTQKTGAGLTDQQVRVRVLGLGALEYALLAPAACVVAIQLLADGHSPSLALTLPWAIAVPIGFVAALWAVRSATRSASTGSTETPTLSGRPRPPRSPGPRQRRCRPAGTSG